MKLSFYRAAVGTAAVGFFCAALAFWIVPSESAAALGIDGLDPVGAAAIRVELGGLFLGLALLCGVAAATRARPWLLGAGAVLGALVTSRLVGAAVGDGLNWPSLIVELAALGALAGLAASEGARLRPLRSVVAASAVVALVAGAAAFASPTALHWAFDHGARQVTVAPNRGLLADDALRVAVCGSSAPLPSPDRAKACVAVFAGGRFYVVDVGPESVENLVRWNVPLSSIGGVLLTHFHSDHIGDLGELNLQTWAGGRPTPLPVFGGPGVEDVVAGFNAAYTHDQGYRTAHHGPQVMPPGAWPMVAHPVTLDGPPTAPLDRTGLVLDEGELRITAIEVNHAPIAPAYAYRFDYKGRSVVVSGDMKNHPPLAVASRGADVLISEAIAPQMTRSIGAAAQDVGRESTARIMHDIEDYHITPAQAAHIANDAGVKLLVFYHLLPAPDTLLTRRLFAQGIDDVRPAGWTLADDGSLYTLPLGQDDVLVGRIGA